jgi:hypothetical protein
LVQLCFDFYMIEAKRRIWSVIALTTAILWMKNCVETASSDRATPRQSQQVPYARSTPSKTLYAPLAH